MCAMRPDGVLQIFAPFRLATMDSGTSSTAVPRTSAASSTTKIQCTATAPAIRNTPAAMAGRPSAASSAMRAAEMSTASMVRLSM